MSSATTIIDQLEIIIDNMLLEHKTGLILAGATGIGKTSFIKQMGQLFGLPVFLVEAPHVTPEHLINIPFLVIKPTGQEKKNKDEFVNQLEKDNKYSVVLSKSYLATELNTARRLSDAQLLQQIYKSSRTFQEIWQEMGGDQNTIPREILKVRAKYRGILFLDEYFRNTDSTVRNILRGILNGKIGNDRVPKGVYVIYASNFSDVGNTVEPPALNADFKKLDFKPPSKDEFFNYMVAKFEKDTDNKLKPEVIEAFKKEVKEEHISYDDLETEIRTSPRRWEQLLLYINASIPVKSEKDAARLLASVRANFQHENTVSSLHKLVEGIVRKIIAKSTPNFANVTALSNEEWRDILAHQIEIKIKVGEARSYIPAIQGPPGIGKTAAVLDITNELNMRLVYIDCSLLDVEEITGIPIPSEGTGDEEGQMSTDFGEPSLYKKIQEEIRIADADFFGNPEISKEEKAAYKKKKYKYVIFFDELNRCKTSGVFNSLRRVILEKSFTDQLRLPKDSIIVAALNPYDRGTQQLTNHVRDSMDLVDTAPSWSATIQYIKSISDSEQYAEYRPEAKSAALSLLSGFVSTFAIKRNVDNIRENARNYWIKVGSDMVYISPREYTTMYLDLIAALERGFRKQTQNSKENIDRLTKISQETMMRTISMVFEKHQVNSPEWVRGFENWVARIFQEQITKKRDASVTLKDVFDHVLENPLDHLKDDPEFVNYVNNKFSVAKFSEDLDNYLDHLCKKEKEVVDLLLKKTHKKKEFRDAAIIELDEFTDKINYLIDEILIAARANNLSGDIIDQMKSTIQNKVSSLPGADWAKYGEEIMEYFLRSAALFDAFKAST